MSIRCVQPSTCHAKKYGQQGFVSMVTMILLVVVIFMGQGLLIFLQQGTENSYSLRQKMKMRLVAESMAAMCYCSYRDTGALLSMAR